MLLRNRLHNPQALINAGMLCFAVAILAQRFLHPASDFWQGFIAGLTGILIGLSIVFNIRGLILRREQKR